MFIKNPKPAVKIILGCAILVLVATACNNSADNAKKEPAADTSVKAAPATVDTSAMKMDTTKMDTATTRPVKNPS